MTNTIRFSVDPNFNLLDDEESQFSACLAIWPDGFEGNMYDSFFDEEIEDALGAYGVYEVQEGIFGWEGEEPFDVEDFILFLKEKGITAIREE